MARGGRREGAGRPKGAPDLRRDAMARVAAAYLHPRVAASREDAEEVSELDGDAPGELASIPLPSESV